VSRYQLYLALYSFSELGVEFVMSNIRFSKVAVDNMALSFHVSCSAQLQHTSDTNEIIEA
jgi:hypothetical protein